jgi:hypothetical protein
MLAIDDGSPIHQKKQAHFCRYGLCSYFHPFLWKVAVLRIRDVYPGSPISDPGSNNSTKRGGGKSFCPTIFCSHKYHKIVNNFIFEQVKNIFFAKTLRKNLSFSYQTHKNMGLGSGIPDPVSGKKLIPDPGSKRHRIPDPQHWELVHALCSA